MRSPSLSSFTLPFTLGLLLGGTAAWYALAPGADEPPGQPGSPAAIPLPPWSWQTSPTPPLFDSRDAARAVSAWLALRASSDGSATFSDRADTLRALLVRLPAQSFPGLVDALSARGEPDDHRLRRIAFAAWVDLDAASAARWAGSVGEGRLDLARLAVRTWAASDAAAAATWACGLPDQAVSDELAAIALAALAKTGPELALALLSSREEASREKLLAALVASLAQTDPVSALQNYGLELWKNGRGFDNLRESLVTWAKKDPAAAAAWIIGRPREHDRNLNQWLRALLGGKTDRPRIATAIMSTPGIPDRDGLVAGMMMDWSVEKPVEALAWLDNLGDPRLRARVIEWSADHYRIGHPENSLHFALALPEGARRFERVRDLLRTWAEHAPSAALAWIRAQNDPDVASASTAVHAKILETIARDEPATAVAEWAALPDMRSKQAALMPIADAWAHTDPEAALKWVTTEEVGKAAGFGGITRPDLFFAWSRKAPEAALRWAEDWAKAEASNHDRADIYLSALAGYGGEKTDPTATAALYAKIEDPALRTRTLAKHVREWLAKDPAAARAWLESTSAVTPGQAAALLAPAR